MLQETPRQLIFQGAEAKVYKVIYNGGFAIQKERISKPYRHPQLDKKITKDRVKSQTNILQKVHKLGIAVPTVLKTIDNTIIMQYIQGTKLKDWFNQKQTQTDIVKQLMKMGFLVSKLHQHGIIHGDLTTSNMIINKDDKLYLIDFGLSYVKNMAEAKAVDLYVLQRAFISTHPQLQQKFSIFYQGYGDEVVIKRLSLGIYQTIQQDKEEERKLLLVDNNSSYVFNFIIIYQMFQQHQFKRILLIHQKINCYFILKNILLIYKLQIIQFLLLLNQRNRIHLLHTLYQHFFCFPNNEYDSQICQVIK